MYYTYICLDNLKQIFKKGYFRSPIHKAIIISELSNFEGLICKMKLQKGQIISHLYLTGVSNYLFIRMCYTVLSPLCFFLFFLFPFIDLLNVACDESQSFLWKSREDMPSFFFFYNRPLYPTVYGVSLLASDGWKFFVAQPPCVVGFTFCLGRFINVGPTLNKRERLEHEIP